MVGRQADNASYYLKNYTLEEVAAKLRGVRQGDSYRFPGLCCGGNKDNPSFSVETGRNGKLIWHCFQCNDQDKAGEALYEALTGQSLPDYDPPPAESLPAVEEPAAAGLEFLEGDYVPVHGYPVWAELKDPSSIDSYAFKLNEYLKILHPRPLIIKTIYESSKDSGELETIRKSWLEDGKPNNTKHTQHLSLIHI